MKRLLPLLMLLCGSAASAQIATGNSLAIPAAGQYVEIADATSATVSANMTIEAWIYYCCNANNSGTVLTKGWCGTNYGYFFSVDGRNLVWGWQRTGTGTNCTFVSNYRTSSDPIPYNTWTHVAVVHTSTSVAFYVNGAPVAGSLTQGSYGGITLSSQPLRIGAYRRADGAVVEPMIGRVDDLRIWNTARTAIEIQNNYTTELAGSEAGLVAYYKLNESGTGAGIPVANSATSTAGLYNGTTVGANVNFQSNATPPVCYAGAPPANCVAVLPIMLENFTAAAAEDGARLQWSVAAVEGLQDFVVERSSDGIRYEALTRLAAVINQHHYNFIDAEAADGKNFYRVTLKLRSGQTLFSSIAAVTLPRANDVVISPVPASDHLSIRRSGSSSTCDYSMLSLDGRIVMRGTLQSERTVLDVSRLPAGTYLLCITGADGYRQVQRIVVAR